MTDKEVQKLSRKELLEFLLDAQTENEALRKDRAELRKQLRALEEELAVSREALSKANADLSRARDGMALAEEAPSDAGAQAAIILQEARMAADNVANTQREANAAKEQHLQEWERRLQQKDELLLQKEAGVKKLIAAADSEASRCIQEAADSADETRRRAEETAEELRKTSEAQAAEAVRKAEAAAALVLHNAEEAARATEEKAAADAELMLQRAQEDSDAFWQDVSELIQKRLFSDGGGCFGADSEAAFRRRRDRRWRITKRQRLLPPAVRRPNSSAGSLSGWRRSAACRLRFG